MGPAPIMRIDSISFCLFDTSSRAFKGENVLNNKKKSFQCKINFEINDLDYFIDLRTTINI